LWQERWLPAAGWQNKTLRPLFQSFWGQSAAVHPDPGSAELDLSLASLWTNETRA